VSVNFELSGRAAFQKQLAFGQLGETQVARWLLRRGHILLPVYDIEYVDGNGQQKGKGPRIFAQFMSYIAPDFLSWRRSRTLWIECKHKTRFSWYGKGHCWESGIDLRCYEDYCRLRQKLGIPLWILFYHDCPFPLIEDLKRWRDCPAACPTGLFAGEIERLRLCESHRSDRHGTSGMVYWAVHSLQRIATVEAVLRAQEAP
jgi:hypothetical protein